MLVVCLLNYNVLICLLSLMPLYPLCMSHVQSMQNARRVVDVPARPLDSAGPKASDVYVAYVMLKLVYA